MSTLVILHGWMQDKSYWQPATERLSDDIRVVTFDLPGFGAEPLVSTDWSIPDYARFVEDKIINMKLDSVILLGHSFGGRIASYIASSNPHWLKGLILYAAPCVYRPTMTIKLKILMAKALKLLHIKRKFIRNTELHQADTSGIGKIARNAIPFDQTALLPNISLKTYVVWGSRDEKVSNAVISEIVRLIPNNELIVIENGGHNLHLDNQTLFYGILKNIIKKY